MDAGAAPLYPGSCPAKIMTMSDTPLRTPTLLSLVAPVYNEEELVEEFAARASAAIADYEFELVLVNDGSSDRTPELLDRLAASDPRIRVVHLSRNFGHQAALTAGLEHAVGDVVAMIDADLQDPPELIPDMLAQWSQGADVVYAVRKQREGETAFKLATASWFYKLFDKLAQVDLEPNSGDFRLLDRRALNALLAMTERSRFLRGMTVWVGFTQTAVSYQRDARHAGETKYTLRKMLRFSLDAIASFSHLPLQLATYAGLLSAGVGVHRDPGRDRAAHRRLLPPRLRLDHDRDPAARRHPADRPRRDRRVRRAHLRRGQAPAVVHRARGAQPARPGMAALAGPQPARAGLSARTPEHIA